MTKLRQQQEQQPRPQQQQPQQGQGEKCTTDPADRAACRFPKGAQITPNGGDLDGDGVFEKNEPVGPGYKDPRVYDGGKTSGETQCDWLRQQGISC
ncbi:hypothetical protein ABZW18_10365 [Streptomyces sp. NPDC004647]|uniref:hypothetical protein n=1 Tax=Streptomyces sp. NPDC004647 TaxID=3154671 RepID=UPI00339DF460